MNVIIHIDGGARGNPGTAGAGIVLRAEDDTPLIEAGYYLGHQTNNFAEYTALLRALEAAKRIGAKQLLIHSDSELLVRQINGEYRVRNPALKDLFDDAFARLRDFEKWEVKHVRREQNSRADELANLAMDICGDVVEVDWH